MEPVTIGKAMARLQIDVDADLKQRLKVFAAQTDQTMSQVIEQALEKFLPIESKP
jgi:predicted transcriptional regulator